MEVVNISERYGKGMIRTKSGGPVISEAPLACVLSSASRTRACDHCWRVGGVRRCAGCKYAYYHGGCQRAAWPRHKKECPLLASKGHESVRLAISILTHRDETVMERVMQLQCNWDLLSSHVMTSLTQVGVAMGRKLKLPSNQIARIPRLLAIIRANTFNVPAPSYTSDTAGGVAIYETLSRINHSCKPNCTLVFSGSPPVRATVKPLHGPVPQGAQIFISYVPTRFPRRIRLAILNDHFHFKCSCGDCGPYSIAVCTCGKTRAFNNSELELMWHHLGPSAQGGKLSLPASLPGQDDPCSCITPLIKRFIGQITNISESLVVVNDPRIAAVKRFDCVDITAPPLSPSSFFSCELRNNYSNSLLQLLSGDQDDGTMANELRRVESILRDCLRYNDSADITDFAITKLLLARTLVWLAGESIEVDKNMPDAISKSNEVSTLLSEARVSLLLLHLENAAIFQGWRDLKEQLNLLNQAIRQFS